MQVNLDIFKQKFQNNITNEEPVFIQIESESELKELKSFAMKNGLGFQNTIKEQLKEYKEIYIMFHGGDENSFDQHIADTISNNGVLGEYVFFNWGEKSIFNILPHKMHYELITWRNKDKILHEEQEIIAKKKLAIVGSSVGSFTSKILSKSGFQHFKIAEPKNMKPSNAPRMYADSIRNYGIHKLIPLVQTIYEFNPYAVIETYQNGINEGNLDFFFKDIDVVIDAADDATAKTLIHNQCEKLRLPLVYGFDEMGSLIVHRYDRPELNTYNPPRFSLQDLADLKTASHEDYILKLIEFIPGENGLKRLTQRQQDTIAGMLNETRGGFSQLAWEAALFGSCLSKATIDIVLGNDISGVRFIDLDVLITEEMLVERAKVLCN